VALDVKTGKLLWYKQFGPNDANDRDLSQVSPLFSATVKGKPRDLLTVSGKDGLLRMLDRNSHETLYELPITTRTDFDKVPVVGGVHGCPGLLGGMEWNGPAYSPSTKTLYVATVDWCGTFTKTDQPPEFTEHAHYYGGAVTPDPREQARGWLQALETPMANAAGRRRHRHFRRHALHRRSQQRLPRHRREQRQDALPLQHRRLDRRRRHQLRDRRQAVRCDDVGCGLRVLRRKRHVGDHHLFASLALTQRA
jgi:hypothetical protein